MKKQEIKKLTKSELVKNIDKYKKDLFNFRFQKPVHKLLTQHKLGKQKKQSQD